MCLPVPAQCGHFPVPAQLKHCPPLPVPLHSVQSPVALQTLLNQGFEVKAASTSAQGVQMLYLQKAAMLYACPINVSGLACSRIASL